MGKKENVGFLVSGGVCYSLEAGRCCFDSGGKAKDEDSDWCKTIKGYVYCIGMDLNCNCEGEDCKLKGGDNGDRYDGDGVLEWKGRECCK